MQSYRAAEKKLTSAVKSYWDPKRKYSLEKSTTGVRTGAYQDMAHGTEVAHQTRLQQPRALTWQWHAFPFHTMTTVSSAA